MGGGSPLATPTDLTDAQWERIAPLLPAPKASGRPRADNRTTLNGILFVLRNGLRWQDLPERYGSPVTCWRRLAQWDKAGVWEKIWRTLLRLLDEQQKLGCPVGAEQGLPGWLLRAGEKGGTAVGLTKRGKGSKLMLVTDGKGVPLGFLVESANAAEIALADDTLATIHVPQPRGCPKTRPRELVADKAYGKDLFRTTLRWRGIHPCIPERKSRKPRPGPSPKLRLDSYRLRWHGERSFAWRQNFQRLVVRYERSAQMFEAFVLLAFILICLCQF